MTSSRGLLIFCTSLLAFGCITEKPLKPELKASPKEAAIVNLQLGAQYLRQGDFELAVSKLQKAVDQNPKLPQAHSTLALAYERVGRPREAEAHYLKAQRLAKDDPAIDNLYGAYLCRNDQIDKAEKYFLRAAKNPRYGTPEAAYSNAGVCALRSEDLGKAEDYFRSALRVNERYADALWNMADLSHKRDRDLQARAFLERLAATTRLPPGALWLGLQVETSLGDSNAAAEYARRLKAEFPDSRETGMLLEQERNGG